MASNETAEAAPPPVFTPPALPDPLPVDRSYQADVIACCVICCLISTVFVGLRFYTRRILLNVLGWEDCFILLSLVCLGPPFGSFISSQSLTPCDLSRSSRFSQTGTRYTVGCIAIMVILVAQFSQSIYRGGSWPGPALVASQTREHRPYGQST